MLLLHSKPTSTIVFENSWMNLPLFIWTIFSSTLTFSKSTFSTYAQSYKNFFLAVFSSSSRNVNSTYRRSTFSASSSPLRASLWTPTALFPSLNGQCPLSFSISKYSLDLPISTAVLLMGILVSYLPSLVSCAKTRNSSGLPIVKLLSTNSSSYSRLHLSYATSTPIYLSLFSLIVRALPFPVFFVNQTQIQVFFVPSPFGLANVSLPNATTTYTIAKCLLLSSVSSIGVIISKDPSIPYEFVPIIRTLKVLWPPKSSTVAKLVGPKFYLVTTSFLIMSPVPKIQLMVPQDVQITRRTSTLRLMLLFLPLHYDCYLQSPCHLMPCRHPAHLQPPSIYSAISSTPVWNPHRIHCATESYLPSIPILLLIRIERIPRIHSPGVMDYSFMIILFIFLMTIPYDSTYYDNITMILWLVILASSKLSSY